MEISVHNPSEILKPWIESYMQVNINWAEPQQLASIWRLIPYGKASIIFLQGDPHHYSTPGAIPELTADAFLVGQMKAPIVLKFRGHTKMIKIQFKPAGLRQFMKHDIAEFTNQASVPLDLIWGSAVNSVKEQLEAFPGLTISVLNNFFEERLLPRLQQTDYINAAIEQFEMNMGNMALTDLLSRLYISGRHLERIFRRIVGLTPMDYRKLIRLNQAFKYLEKNPGTSFTDLSHRSGYYDQAHFTHDFKQFAGSPPSKMRSLNNELIVTHGKCFIGNTLQ